MHARSATFPVHDCSFVARSHLSRLRHSCSLLVFTMSLNLSGIELQPTVISLGNALGPPPSVPPSMNNMIGKAPPGSRPPRASPTTLFQSKSHLDSREIYRKNFVTEDSCNLVEFQIWTGRTKHGTSEASRPTMTKQSSCKLCCQ